MSHYTSHLIHRQPTFNLFIYCLEFFDVALVESVICERAPPNFISRFFFFFFGEHILFTKVLSAVVYQNKLVTTDIESITNRMEEGSGSLEDQIYEVSDLIENYVNDFVEGENDFDLINDQITDFSKFNDNKIIDSIKTEKDTILELSTSRVLANFIDLKTSENDQNLKQIATLVDLTFYFKENNQSRFNLPLLLICLIIKESSVVWLLKFWNFFELRVDLIKGVKDGEVLQANKFPGTNFMVALNLKLKQLENSNEPNRDILRARVLSLSSKVFAISDRSMINRRFEFNEERSNELEIPRSNYRRSKYATFWKLQHVLANPIKEMVSERDIQDFMHNVEESFNLIYEIEKEQHGGPFEGVKSKEKENHDNSIEYYTKASLAESKKEELREFYASREFSPSFFKNEERFNEQLRKDKYLRRAVLSQLYFYACWVINLSDSPEIQSGPKFANHKLKRFSRMLKLGSLLSLKKDIQYIFQSTDKRFFFVNQQFALSDQAFLTLKLSQFSDYVNVYDDFKVDEEFYNQLEKIGQFKSKNFHEYGTPQISRHWKTSTGLDLLAKDESNGKSEQIDKDLERLRESIKTSTDENVKNLNSWKALRLARKKHLFKFKQVNESTGLEGLFDSSLKEEFDKKKQEEELQRAQEEEERQEKFKKEQEEREMEELKKKEEERVELERKRKASEEEFAEQSKRAKLESANGTKDSEDLDY